VTRRFSPRNCRTPSTTGPTGARSASHRPSPVCASSHLSISWTTPPPSHQTTLTSSLHLCLTAMPLPGPTRLDYPLYHHHPVPRLHRLCSPRLRHRTSNCPGEVLPLLTTARLRAATASLLRRARVCRKVQPCQPRHQRLRRPMNLCVCGRHHKLWLTAHWRPSAPAAPSKTFTWTRSMSLTFPMTTPRCTRLDLRHQRLHVAPRANAQQQLAETQSPPRLKP
jgi:hypothetical protein